MAELHNHYDLFRHDVSAMPQDVLQHDYWVPGVDSRMQVQKFKGKPIFAQILTTTEVSACTYLRRVCKDRGGRLR